MKKSFLTAAILLAMGAPAFGADLVEVYKQAQQSDPQLAAATAAHGAALEAKPQARAAILPKLSASAAKSQVSAENNDAGTSDDYGTTSYSVSLLQPLYHHDYFVQLGQANTRIAQANAEYAAAKQGLIVRTSSAYFNKLAAEDNLRFAQAEKAAIEQQLRQTQQRFDVGLTAITDVREAQARYDAAVAQEIAAQNQLDLTNEQLRELTGEEYARLNVLGDVPLVTPEPADINAWVNTALAQNLSLLSAQAQAETAQKEISRRRAAGFPTLDLTASVNHSDADSDAVPSFNYDNDNTVVGLQVSWPFYQGGLVSSRTREAEQLYNQAKAGLDAQRRATVRQTRDAYLGVQAGMSQVEALKQALTSAETALEATTVGYEVGTRTAVDVLDAQRQTFLAQRNYASARYNYVLSILRLKQAAGTLSETDLQQVNGWLAAPPTPAPTEPPAEAPAAAPVPEAPAAQP